MADNSQTLTLTLQVKDDGSVVVDTVKGKVDSLNQSTVSGGSSVADILGQVKTAWLGYAAAALAAYETVKSYIDAASEAEQIQSRMAFQLGAAGYKFQEIKPFVDEFADSILQTTRYSRDMAEQGLGQMMQYTTDVNKAMSGVKLAMDMATQTGQDLGSTTRYVGMAMQGDVEILGRWIPELRNLDATLGSSATSADKAAYAFKILNEKFAGASAADLETYAGKVQQLKNQLAAMKEETGKTLIGPATGWAEMFTALAKTINYMKEGGLGLGSLKKQWDDWQAEIKAAPALAQQRAAAASAADLAEWKKNQEQRQQINFSMAEQEWTIRKNNLALIDAQELDVTKKAKKYGADLSQIRSVFHLKRLEEIAKEKEEELNAAQTLATMWKGYYDERIAKQKEVIDLVKASGVQTTVEAKSEFAAIEEEFRKIMAQSSMFTKDELDQLKAAYAEKVKALLPAQTGQWEEFQSPTGGATVSGTNVSENYGTDYRWIESGMTALQQEIETIRQATTTAMQGMFTAAQPGAAANTQTGVTGITDAFDLARNKALELQQTIEQVKDQKLQVDTSNLLRAIQDVDSFNSKILALVGGDYKVKLSVEILGDEFVQELENKLAMRMRNNRSQLGPVLQQQIDQGASGS
ncbi:MAG: hypothetical protein ACLQGU_04305 [bacterium]